MARRHFFAPAFAALGLMALGASPLAAQTKWNLPSAYPADNFHTENIAQFAKDVEAATGGKLVITLHPNASLFKAPEIKRAVATGQAQAGEVIMSIHENEDPIFGIDVVPFLATSYESSKKLWAASRPFVEKKMEAQGLMVLYAVPWPPQGIFSKNPVTKIEDLKGAKWRAYNVGTSRIGDLLGAQSVTVQQAELAQALATGVVTALITSAATGYDVKIWESIPYFYDVQAWLPKNMVFVNKAAFEALDKPTQEAVLKAAAAAEERGWKSSIEKSKWYVEQLQAKGMKVEAPSAELRAGFEKIGAQLTADWIKKAGPDGEAALAAFKK
ncbi:MAG: C4-dicarboxylate ABC transporter substrate-binding protein [Rhizobiales bacterium 32-66-11]|jgi:TRAP-type C4-dicarboxylate transport system substrate-binding protein|nr:MAG: C4-dicarboxylate ABC transporter substrate-binding protein [Rhizobiales bacterium 32-66-11]